MDSKIEQGEFCPKCGNFIPRFTKISKDTEAKISSFTPNVAIKELRGLSGCDIATAKVWYAHPNGPHSARVKPPCPFCGKALSSEKSRRCRQCGWDWHELDHPKNLAKGLARGEEAIRLGKILSHEEAKGKLKHWLMPP